MTNRFNLKYRWSRNFFRPLIFVILFFIVYFFSFGMKGITHFHIQLAIIIIVANYLLFMQYEISNITLDFEAKELIVSYPVSFLLKTKTYKFSNIEKIHFKYHPGPYGTPKYYIYLKEGLKKKHYIPGDIKELIEKLKSENIDVLVDKYK